MYWGSGPGVARGSKSGQDKRKSRKSLMLKTGSVGDELEILEQDREIHTDPQETRRRRTIKLHKDRGSWGFTLQTYGIKNKRSNELEVMTYVDYVELNTPASFAGMRKGDVILSVNGNTVEGWTHSQLVTRIKQSSQVLRLVVLFEDCCRKVELYDRFIKLKQLLSLKHEKLRQLELQEMSILEANGITRLSEIRQSIRSSTSSDWDRFSVVSPSALQSAANSRIWRDFSYPSMTSEHGFPVSNSYESIGAWNDSFSEDSDAFLSSSTSASCPDVSISRQKEDTESTRSLNSQKSFTDESLKSLGSLDSTSSCGSGIVIKPTSGVGVALASSIGASIVYASCSGSGVVPVSVSKISSDSEDKDKDMVDNVSSDKVKSSDSNLDKTEVTVDNYKSDNMVSSKSSDSKEKITPATVDNVSSGKVKSNDKTEVTVDNYTSDMVSLKSSDSKEKITAATVDNVSSDKVKSNESNVIKTEVTVDNYTSDNMVSLKSSDSKEKITAATVDNVSSDKVKSNESNVIKTEVTVDNYTSDIMASSKSSDSKEKITPATVDNVSSGKLTPLKSSDSNLEKTEASIDEYNVQKSSKSNIEKTEASVDEYNVQKSRDANNADNSSEPNSSSKEFGNEKEVPSGISKKSNTKDKKPDDVDSFNESKDDASLCDVKVQIVDPEKHDDNHKMKVKAETVDNSNQPKDITDSANASVTVKQSSPSPADDNNTSIVKIENITQTKGANSETLRTSTEAGSRSTVTSTKRFLHGVLLNDEDRVTKL